MKSSHIYINPQGVPCAPTDACPIKNIENIDLKDIHHALAGLYHWFKKSCIPIREEDRPFKDFNLGAQRLKPDTFYPVEPYEFEVIEMKTPTGLQAGNVENGFKDIAFDISNEARIIRPSEPKADPKEKEFLLPPDHGDTLWEIGAETFTRKEVAYLLWTQRAMIGNDLKAECGNEMTPRMFEILDKPRTPQF